MTFIDTGVRSNIKDCDCESKIAALKCNQMYLVKQPFVIFPFNIYGKQYPLSDCSIEHLTMLATLLGVIFKATGLKTKILLVSLIDCNDSDLGGQVTFCDQYKIIILILPVGSSKRPYTRDFQKVIRKKFKKAIFLKVASTRKLYLPYYNL